MTLFTLVDSEGNEITKEEQLGLLLYRGGTMCGMIGFTAADAICRYMNFTRAERWTNEDQSFAIQRNYNRNQYKFECSSSEWESCRFSTHSSCRENKDEFLSCSGIK